MREKIAEWLRIQGYFQCEGYVRVSQLEIADEILKAITEEIEKKFRDIEANPCGFEEIQRQILSLFRK